MRAQTRVGNDWRTVALLIATALAACWQTPCAGQPAAKPAAKPTTKEDKKSSVAKEDWAKKALDADPLLGVEQVTIDDLRKALADPARRNFALPQHFARAKLTNLERKTLLIEALGNESIAVRRQAAKELDSRGWLVEGLESILREMSRGADPDQANAAKSALEGIEMATGVPGSELDQLAIKALAGDDEALRAAAIERFERQGAAAVPLLLDLIESGNATQRRQAAALLGKIARDKSAARPSIFDQKSGGGGGATTVPKFREQEHEPTSGRQTDDDHPQSVRVYFGTNRTLESNRSDPRWRLWLLPFVALGAIFVLARRWRSRAPKPAAGQAIAGPATVAQPAPRGRLRGAAVFFGSLAILVWSVVNLNSAWREYYSEHVGATFGPRRERSGEVRYGYCDVSIPPTHEVGAVEQPWLGPEDESSHVVLKRTEILADEAFFTAVKDALAPLPKGERSCFVFVHGFFTSFEKAARRTAQIKYDLDFAGAALFYSWPSRGQFLHYASDRNEIQHSHEYVRRFLIDVAERLDADRIHVIAHSTGADAVGRAIVAMGDRGRIFDQIVLAAPDIDADVFREQIAPAMARHARRTTLYCSRNDWAMQASYAFNDSRRAGDASAGVVVVEGADSVDVSKIDTGLLGHSYYADCLPLLRDVAALIERNLPPDERQLTPAFLEDRKAYWLLSQGEKE